MFSDKEICRAGSNRDTLKQSAAKMISNQENEVWIVVEKESIGEYIKEDPNGAEALKNVPTLPQRGEEI